MVDAMERAGAGARREANAQQDDYNLALAELKRLHDTVQRVRTEVMTQRRECVELRREVSGLRAQWRQREEGS